MPETDGFDREDFDAWQNDKNYRRAMNGFFEATKEDNDPAALERYIAKYPKYEKQLRKYDQELVEFRAEHKIEMHWRRLGISAMAARALFGLEIHALEQAAAFSATELSKVRGIGSKAVKIIRTELTKQGLRFKGSPSLPPEIRETAWSLQEEGGNEIGYLEGGTEYEARREAQELANKLNKRIGYAPTHLIEWVDPE